MNRERKRILKHEGQIEIHHDNNMFIEIGETLLDSLEYF